MGCRFCLGAGVESTAANCVGAALPHAGVVAGVCYSVASGTSTEIGAAAT